MTPGHLNCRAALVADEDGVNRLGRAALVEVWDENAMPPSPVKPGLADEGGRGLMLVDALSERWGWDLPSSGQGKFVWALVER